MIKPKSEAEIKDIAIKFDVPKLSFSEAIDAGPDEELYLFTDENGAKYGVWSRDYMSELKYEANGLNNDLNITVNKWIKLKASDEFILDVDGLSYAVFSIK